MTTINTMSANDNGQDHGQYYDHDHVYRSTMDMAKANTIILSTKDDHGHGQYTTLGRFCRMAMAQTEAITVTTFYNISLVVTKQ